MYQLSSMDKLTFFATNQRLLYAMLKYCCICIVKMHGSLRVRISTMFTAKRNIYTSENLSGQMSHFSCQASDFYITMV